MTPFPALRASRSPPFCKADGNIHMVSALTSLFPQTVGREKEFFPKFMDKASHYGPMAPVVQGPPVASGLGSSECWA